MNDYLKSFANHSAYSAAESQLIKPNVSYCIQENEVHYNPITNSSLYLTFDILTNGTVGFEYIYGNSATDARYIEYSTDNGGTWVKTDNVNNQTVTVTVNVSAGDKIMWRGDNDAFCSWNGDEYEGSHFTSTSEFNAKGNVMSLLYGSNFLNQTEIENDYALCDLFYGYYGSPKIVSAENLILPATTLSEGCYRRMFGKCTSLTTPPELPATTLSHACYVQMFNGCSSLATAPVLPATTLADSCYIYMFQNCTSLTSAPTLPATTLNNHCYNSMFSGCTGITTAPVLPATTLMSSSYQYMFMGCTSLNSITCLATNISAYNCTYRWVSGVAASGTFVKNASMSDWTSGLNGIPNGWTEQNA